MDIVENFFEKKGFCPICNQATIFSSINAWFRDSLLCKYCKSIPRERALYKVMRDLFPNYIESKIHESSPSNRGASLKLKAECSQYTASHFFENVGLGEIDPITRFRCENLENLTFENETFDLFITQDVMEHILSPAEAFREIFRVLRPGGSYIFSVPLVNKDKKSFCRASKNNEEIIVLHDEPTYHGNPIDGKGSLVTMDWGYDITQFILDSAPFRSVTTIEIDDLWLGIRAQFIDILVCSKAP
jgi:SAM-dependent methyltransferase